MDTSRLDPLDCAPEAADKRIEEVIELYKRHVNPQLAKLMQFGGFGDIEVSGEGCYITTASGARYLDFLGSYGVFALGHCHPAVVRAVHDQLDRLPLSTRTFFNEQAARLADALTAVAPAGLEFCFFSNSGAEAVEAALKFARMASGKPGVISTVNSFHGKTMGALSATGRESYRKPFEPLLPGFTHVPYGDAGAVESAISETTGAVIVEAIQGEGGIIVPPDGYLRALRAICDSHGILLIADEVQTGMGRTGQMFACQHEGVSPDILTAAKALGGGVMPIGATLATASIWEKVFDVNPLMHTSTFGGNPLACAAALATLQVIEDENLPRKAQDRGAQLLRGLERLRAEFPSALKAVRGRGLMVGVEFAVKDVAEITINALARHGVIVAYTLNNPKVIRLEPPLIVTEQQIDTVLAALRDSIREAVEMLEGLDQ